MTDRITVTSTNPAFVDFPLWIAQKIADYRASSQYIVADQLQATVDAKKAAEAAAGWALISVEGSVYTVPTAASPTTPEFEALWAEWKAEFDVSIVTETI